jgi:threonine/homoserine/homoserine lactone efflux protein
MNWNALSSTEKLAVYGSVATLLGGIIGGTVSALGWLAFLAAIGMLVVVFLPQFSPSTTLPGSKGSFMLILGAVAGIVMVLGLLTILSLLGYYFQFAAVNAIFFLIGVAGGIVMAWAGWQAFQAEGGKFQIGSGGTGAGPGSSAPPPPPPGAPSS